jgi:cyclophilin family peptidyl-prolyl cis-trans isomerase
MMRARLGLLLTLLALSGCDHHKPAAPSSASTGTSTPPPAADSAYTGQPPKYPRAALVSLPPTTQPTPPANSPALSPITEAAPPPIVPTATTTSAASVPTLDSSLPSSSMAAPSPVAAAPETNAPDIIPPTPVSVAQQQAMDDDEAKKQVVILATSFGRIVIQLDDVAAPRTCGNFRKLVSDGFYNHTTFHRVIPNFMIQGGDPNSKTDDRATYGQGDPGYTLPAEIKLKHVAGAVAMARLPDSVNPQRDSNGSQFFICVSNAPSLDDQYTVFGHVIAGMDVVNKIATQPRDERDNPTSRIEMEATLEPKKQALEEGTVP